MVFNKKPLEAQDELIPYSVDLEDRVEGGFDATKIESGSNSNGSWIKFPDGTMIVRNSITLHYLANAYVQSTWYFPQTFIEEPHVTGSIKFNSSSRNPVYLGGMGFWSKEVHRCFPRVYNNELAFVSGDSLEVDVVAIGRWK